MKVQFNEEAEKKFTKEYFVKNNFVKKTYEYKFNNIDKDMLHIAFNIDSNFFMPAGVTITSVLENNPEENLTFHIFADSVKDDDLDRLRKTAEKYKQNCIVYIMDMEPFNNFHIKHARFKKVSYFRLYMPKVLQKMTDKFLYIDADLICMNSIRPFFSLNLNNKVLAVVSDLKEACENYTKFLGLASGQYFNSGVLLIDIKKWNENNITEKCFSYQGVNPEKFNCHDQDVLNLVIDGNAYFIDNKFNYLGVKNGVAPQDCIIYHFFGREKPWNIALTKYDKLWRKYLEISFWDNIEQDLPLKEPKNYHNYKYAGDFYFQQGAYLKAFQCYFWYAVLKIKFKL